MKYILTIVMGLVLVMAVQMPAQNRQIRELRHAYTAPDEIVSLSGTMPFNQALLIFNDLSKKYLGKIIVDPGEHKMPIGENINQKHWLDAFEQILRRHNLWYKEHADYIEIVPMETEEQGLSEEEKKAKIHFLSREVTISAIFFETNKSKLREAGMSWDFFRGKDVNLSTRLTASDTKTGLYEIEVNPDLDFGSLLAIFKAMENDKIGEVIASPQVTVKSGEQGRVQVGSDVAVTTRDFAGNAITQFFSTGSIIKVKPTVFSYDSIEFVNMELEVERSNTATSASGLEIKKSNAKTSVMLLDGEETVIGGLYVNEESGTREGVPFLKDLPWWMLGLRYVFGYNSKSTIKKELLILIKAHILPDLKTRFMTRLKPQYQRPSIGRYREKMKGMMEYYKRTWKGK